MGKYVDLKESYKSLHEALVHGAIHENCEVDVVYVDAEALTQEGTQEEKAKKKKAEQDLLSCHSVLVPGGFGLRGVEGKIRAVEIARTKNIPFLGICMGMQIALIEFARNLCGLKGATSKEFQEEMDCKETGDKGISARPKPKLKVEKDESKGKGQRKDKNKAFIATMTVATDVVAPVFVIDLMEEQKKVEQKGGSMRLGSYPCHLSENSKVRSIYGKELVNERHRHRYEFNNQYLELFKSKGLRFSGWYKKGPLAEIVELEDHPWFIGVQFHPEFNSKPIDAHPLFASFIGAAKNAE